MTFGRPNMTTILSASPRTSNEADLGPNFDTDLKLRFLTENVRLGKVLEGILSKIYQPWLKRSSMSGAPTTSVPDIHHSMDNIVELHMQLTRFEKSLPLHLSWESPTSLDLFSQEDRQILETQKTVLHAR